MLAVGKEETDKKLSPVSFLSQKETRVGPWPPAPTRQHTQLLTGPWAELGPPAEVTASGTVGISIQSRFPQGYGLRLVFGIPTGNVSVCNYCLYVAMSRPSPGGAWETRGEENVPGSGVVQACVGGRGRPRSWGAPGCMQRE